MARDVRVLPEIPGMGGLLARGVVTSLRRPGASGGLPDRTAMVLDHRLDLAPLAAYNRVCGFGLADAVPATWLHVLTFPLQGFLLAQPDFPFPLAGMVHLANEMTLHRPVTVGESVRLSVRAQNLVPHRRGAAFQFIGEAHVKDELVWSGITHYLAPKAIVPGEPVRLPRLEAPDVEPSQVWRLPADLGRQYAAVSGDSNPIHLHPLTARLFGFPRPIAHGMWTHARALAALGPRVPQRYTVAVSFTKPILLPGTVRFAAAPDADGWRFAVHHRNKPDSPHMIGTVTPPQ